MQKQRKCLHKVRFDTRSGDSSKKEKAGKMGSFKHEITLTFQAHKKLFQIVHQKLISVRVDVILPFVYVIMSIIVMNDGHI